MNLPDRQVGARFSFVVSEISGFARFEAAHFNSIDVGGLFVAVDVNRDIAAVDVAVDLFKIVAREVFDNGTTVRSQRAEEDGVGAQLGGHGIGIGHRILTFSADMDVDHTGGVGRSSKVNLSGLFSECKIGITRVVQRRGKGARQLIVTHHDRAACKLHGRVRGFGQLQNCRARLKIKNAAGDFEQTVALDNERSRSERRASKSERLAVERHGIFNLERTGKNFIVGRRAGKTQLGVRSRPVELDTVIDNRQPLERTVPLQSDRGIFDRSNRSTHFATVLSLAHVAARVNGSVHRSAVLDRNGGRIDRSLAAFVSAVLVDVVRAHDAARIDVTRHDRSRRQSDLRSTGRGEAAHLSKPAAVHIAVDRAVMRDRHGIDLRAGLVGRVDARGDAAAENGDLGFVKGRENFLRDSANARLVRFDVGGIMHPECIHRYLGNEGPFTKGDGHVFAMHENVGVRGVGVVERPAAADQAVHLGSFVGHFDLRITLDLRFGLNGLSRFVGSNKANKTTAHQTDRFAAGNVHFHAVSRGGSERGVFQRGIRSRGQGNGATSDGHVVSARDVERNLAGFGNRVRGGAALNVGQTSLIADGKPAAHDAKRDAGRTKRAGAEFFKPAEHGFDATSGLSHAFEAVIHAAKIGNERSLFVTGRNVTILQIDRNVAGRCGGQGTILIDCVLREILRLQCNCRAAAEETVHRRVAAFIFSTFADVELNVLRDGGRSAGFVERSCGDGERNIP